MIFKIDPNTPKDADGKITYVKNKDYNYKKCYIIVK